MKRTYTVVLRKSVQKEIAKIPVHYVDRIKRALFHLSGDPYIGKKLVGELSHLRSYRVWPYRIIYEIIRGELVVIVVRIGHRKNVYS